MKKELCENCKKLVLPEVREKESKTEIKGKEYIYIEKVGYCPVCQSEINSEDLMDENLKTIDEIYRKKEHIITKQEIGDILKKYKIGKKPLSKLLGWGEVTLTRYLDGGVPTKPYSDELLKIANNTEYMLQILELNKDNITNKAYESVRNAIYNIQNNKEALTDIELVAQYIISSCKEITPLALQKVLYYAQGFYKIFFGDYLFQNDCEAWVHGPVYVNIYEKYKCFGSSNIEQYLDYDVSEMLDEDKKALLDVIINSFAYYSGKALEKMTHYELPWITARKGILPEEKSNIIIKKENIDFYFKKIKEKYDMVNLLEIKKYSEEQFRYVIFG